MYPLSTNCLISFNASSTLSLFKVSSSLKIFPFLVYAKVKNEVVVFSSAFKGNSIGYSIALLSLSLSKTASISAHVFGNSVTPAFANISLFIYANLSPFA